MNSSLIELGPNLKSSHFRLNPETVFTNHGSYGASPREILAKKLAYQNEMEANPDKWFRYTSFDLWTANVDSLARRFKVSPENMLICENATEAINSILKSIDFDFDNSSGQCVLATQYTYQAVMNSIEYTSLYRLDPGKKIEVVKLDLTFPIRSVSELLEQLDAICDRIVNKRKLNLKLAVFDHIGSPTAIYFPVHDMNKIVRKWASKCLILIDGAHAPGQAPLDFEYIDCDFYVGNLHKWLLAPRGCSLLYFKDKQRAVKHMQPCFISHGYNKDLSYNFYQRGTSDKTSWFVVDECFEFYEKNLGGLDRITSFTSRILDEAVELLVKGWQTRILEIPKEMEAPFMRVIKLPLLKDYQIGEGRNDEDVNVQLMKDVFEKFNVISCMVYLQGEFYCRISCFVYNCLEDYVALRDAVLSLV